MSTQPAWWKSTEAMVAGILLLAMVLIGLVIVFKKQINTLLTNIFKQINSKSKEVY